MNDSLASQKTESPWGRMMLSHNFNLSSDVIPPLSREEFAQVFIDECEHEDHLKGRLLDHPHWIVEVLFESASLSPSQVGTWCAETLAKRRSPTSVSFEILALGGLKTTPPTGDSPDALQPGQWGVDIVETPHSPSFLQALNWDAMVAQKPEGQTFAVTVSLSS